MNQGQTVFAQLIELLPRRAFENAVDRYGGQRRVRSFSCRDQLLGVEKGQKPLHDPRLRFGLGHSPSLALRAG